MRAIYNFSPYFKKQLNFALDGKKRTPLALPCTPPMHTGTHMHAHTFTRTSAHALEGTPFESKIVREIPE